MSTLSQSAGIPSESRHWQPDIVQMMDEAHAAAWSCSTRRRLSFASVLTQFMESMRATEVCVLHGRFIHDLESFCAQLERVIPGEPLERRIDGPGGVVSLLRERNTPPGQRAAQQRFYVWHDADVLLRRDAVLFSRLVEAIVGVAAEAEFVADDLLMVQRLLLVGDESLRRFAQDPGGPMHRWLDEDQGEAFWSVVTGIAAPPTCTLDIDAMWDAPARA